MGRRDKKDKDRPGSARGGSSRHGKDKHRHRSRHGRHHDKEKKRHRSKHKHRREPKPVDSDLDPTEEFPDEDERDLDSVQVDLQSDEYYEDDQEYKGDEDSKISQAKFAAISIGVAMVAIAIIMGFVMWTVGLDGGKKKEGTRDVVDVKDDPGPNLGETIILEEDIIESVTLQLHELRLPRKYNGPATADVQLKIEVSFKIKPKQGRKLIDKPEGGLEVNTTVPMYVEDHVDAEDSLSWSEPGSEVNQTRAKRQVATMHDEVLKFNPSTDILNYDFAEPRVASTVTIRIAVSLVGKVSEISCDFEMPLYKAVTQTSAWLSKKEGCVLIVKTFAKVGAKKSTPRRPDSKPSNPNKPKGSRPNQGARGQLMPQSTTKRKRRGPFADSNKVNRPRGGRGLVGDSTPMSQILGRAAPDYTLINDTNDTSNETSNDTSFQ